MPSLRQIVERQQAAARGAVVAGAEGQRRLDLDAERVRLDAAAVMRAVDDETAGRHRLQPFEALCDPVGRRHRFEGERLRGGVAGGKPHQVAHGGFVRRLAEMDCHLPLAVVAFEGGAGGVLGVQAFTEIGGEAAGGFFVAQQADDGGRRIGHGRRRSPVAWLRAMAMQRPRP